MGKETQQRIPGSILSAANFLLCDLRQFPIPLWASDSPTSKAGTISSLSKGLWQGLNYILMSNSLRSHLVFKKWTREEVGFVPVTEDWSSVPGFCRAQVRPQGDSVVQGLPSGQEAIWPKIKTPLHPSTLRVLVSIQFL